MAESSTTGTRQMDATRKQKSAVGTGPEEISMAESSTTGTRQMDATRKQKSAVGTGPEEIAQMKAEYRQAVLTSFENDESLTNKDQTKRTGEDTVLENFAKDQIVPLEGTLKKKRRKSGK
ncbi:hypothetical protein DdX_08607 [Ditylenchus destructor]|uniref:Uncharacterized protein n=1 Tax=Ditylenchus destructor TaxID=166010 RepID=A0AAD4N4A4_9BILA|nr:hypothetical protein DdX_08607 [Ditylenchus destructor]